MAALLGLVVVAAAGLQGAARFTGLRWVIDMDPGAPSPVPMPSASLRPSAAPGGAGIAGEAGPAMAAVAIAAALLAAFLLWRWLRRRARGPRIGLRRVGALLAPAEAPIRAAPTPEPDAPAVRSGIELALGALDAEREPSDAIMRAWMGLQQTAEESGITRYGAETATEFTQRILSRVSADDRAIRTLLRLYLRTRFGDHPITAADVASARESLRALADSWDEQWHDPRRDRRSHDSRDGSRYDRMGS